MGSNDHYPEEAPVRTICVDAFWIDETPVTNREFSRFVTETGYVTNAEKAPDPARYPGMDPSLAKPGSLVFTKTSGPVDMSEYTRWWQFVLGADWRHPLGPDSTLAGLEEHPVVHVAYADAKAYAVWAGKELPTEEEWEFAARAGLDGAAFAWGEELAPGGAMLANYWQGLFPFANQCLDGWERTSPVRSFPPDAYGLFDMIGNVWEWTQDWYQVPTPGRRQVAKACCTPRHSRDGGERGSNGGFPDGASGNKVLKGGSHLCSPNYCQRYRPAARYPQTVDTSTSHIGFRCVIRCTGAGAEPGSRKRRSRA
jgi:formylglycine-generating enzyme required for sulfatase activity